MSELHSQAAIPVEGDSRSDNKQKLINRLVGVVFFVTATLFVPNSESILQITTVAAESLPDSIDPALIITTSAMPDSRLSSLAPNVTSTPALESTAVTSTSEQVTPTVPAPSTRILTTTKVSSAKPTQSGTILSTHTTPSITKPSFEHAAVPPMQELTGIPTNVALYHVDRTGIHKYIDSPVQVNPTATIIRGETNMGPVFKFEPGCSEIVDPNTPDADCSYVRDYNEVDIMTQRGYPSSLKQENDPRNKTGVWEAGHSTNHPDNPNYLPLSFQLLVTAKPGDLVVQEAKGTNGVMTFIYQVRLTDEIIKHSVQNDPRVNKPEAFKQNMLTLFTCVASNGIVPLDQQQNALVQSVMVGAQSGSINVYDWVRSYYAEALTK